MSDRDLPDLRSRVRIDTSDIDKADRKARELGDTVRRQGDATEPLRGGLRASSDQMAAFGASMTRNVTLPMVAGAGVATALSVDFGRTFTQMQGLAGVASEEIDGLRDSVNDLAIETGGDPGDLAQGLYFIRSAGFEGAAALDVLDRSARASVVGLGTTAEVADALTSAISSYGQENLDAATAADVLTAAVREGKGEASQMAPQLGRLLPIASELGVGFDEVAGSLAFLTRGNGDAAQSSTQLQGILQKIIRPSEQAKEALANAGLSADGLRQVVSEQGLLAALQLLEGRLGTGSEAFGRVFDDSEAFTGSLALLRDNGTEAAEVIQAVGDSAGAVDEAFAGYSDTEAADLNRALSELKVTAIEVGQELAPALADAAKAGSGLLGIFTDLPGPAQTAVIALGGIVALAGPTASGIAGLSKGFQFLRDSSLGSATGLRSILGLVGRHPGAMGAAAIGVGALAGAYIAMTSEAREAEKAADDLVAAALSSGDSIEELFRTRLANSLSGLEDGIAGVGTSLDESLEILGMSAEELFTAITSDSDEAVAAFENLLFAADPTSRSNDQFKSARDAWALAELQLDNVRQRQAELGVETEATTDALEGHETEVGDVTRKAMELGDAYATTEEQLQSLTDAVLAGFDADLNYEDALRDFAGAQDAVTLASEDIRINGWTPERQVTLDEANQALERSTLALSRAELGRAEAHAEAAGETLTAAERNNLLVGSMLRMVATLEPGSPLRERLADTIADLREIAREHTATINIEVNEPEQLGLAAQAALGGQGNPSAFGFLGFGATVGPNNIFGGGAPPAPRGLTTRAPKAAPASVTVAPVFQVTGEPDAKTLQRLERVAERAVRKGMADAGREVDQW